MKIKNVLLFILIILILCGCNINASTSSTPSTSTSINFSNYLDRNYVEINNSDKATLSIVPDTFTNRGFTLQIQNNSDRYAFRGNDVYELHVKNGDNWYLIKGYGYQSVVGMIKIEPYDIGYVEVDYRNCSFPIEKGYLYRIVVGLSFEPDKYFNYDGDGRYA